MKQFTVDGSPIICSEGCIEVCKECHEEMGPLVAEMIMDDDGGPTRSYVGSGDDLPWEIVKQEPEFLPA